MNNVTIIGNLTRDPEGREVGSDSYVADFSIAVNNKKKDDDGNYGVDFINVTAWGSTAQNLVKYQKKGMKLGITGRLETDTWEDKDTGKNRSKTYVVAQNVDWLTTRKDAEAMAGTSSGGGEEDPFAGDDLAF